MNTFENEIVDLSVIKAVIQINKELIKECVSQKTSVQYSRFEVTDHEISPSVEGGNNQHRNYILKVLKDGLFYYVVTN